MQNSVLPLEALEKGKTYRLFIANSDAGIDQDLTASNVHDQVTLCEVTAWDDGFKGSGHYKTYRFGMGQRYWLSGTDYGVWWVATAC